MFLYYFYLFITNKQEETWIGDLNFFAQNKNGRQVCTCESARFHSSEKGLMLDMSDMMTAKFS